MHKQWSDWEGLIKGIPSEDKAMLTEETRGCDREHLPYLGARKISKVSGVCWKS